MVRRDRLPQPTTTLIPNPSAGRRELTTTILTDDSDSENREDDVGEENPRLSTVSDGESRGRSSQPHHEASRSHSRDSYILLADDDNPRVEDSDRDSSCDEVSHDSDDSASDHSHSSQPPTFNAVQHFVEHLSTGFFCTQTEHNNLFQTHCRSLRDKLQSHRDCVELGDLGRRFDPTLRRNQIPNFLERPYFYRGDELYTSTKTKGPATRPDLTLTTQNLTAPKLRLLFEGTVNHNQMKPSRVCMALHDFTSYHLAPTVTVDVDSVCGIMESLAAFRKGWMFYSYTTAGNLMSGTTFGIHIRIEDDALTNGYQLVAPQNVPHILIGTLSSWSYIKIFFLFPKIWVKRRHNKAASNILTEQQQRDLYDLVLYPAFETCLPPNALQEIPTTFDIAKIHAQTSARERGRSTNASASRIQLLTYAIQHEYSLEFTKEIRRNIRKHSLGDFDDLVIFYNGKGMKGADTCPTYTTLAQKWNTRWNSEIDERYAVRTKQWIDLGRQFAAHSTQPEIEPEVLLWKPCCLQKYHETRTKRYKHVSSLPLVKYHLAGLEDAISVTMTARPESAQAAQGAPHSCFYSKTKAAFIVNTIEVFENPNTDVLCYGNGHLAAVASAGGAQTTSIESAANSYIASKTRAHENLESLQGKASEAREEHRLRNDVFLEVLSQLVEREQAVNSPTEPDAMVNIYQSKMAEMAKQLQQVSHLNQDGRIFLFPFYRVSAPDLTRFLRGNLNKACMGVEMVIRDITTPTINHATMATARVFLNLTRYSVLSKLMGRAPELYKDKWTPTEQEANVARDVFAAADSPNHPSEQPPPEIREGLAMSSNMKEYGYAYIAPKMDWTAWRLSALHVNNFFRAEPAFAQAMQKRRQQVLRVDEALKTVQTIQQWLQDVGDSMAKIEHIFDFAIGFIMMLFRHCVWSQLKVNNALIPGITQIQEDELLDGCISLTFTNITTWVKDPHADAPPTPDLTSSNAAFHGGDPSIILDYLFSPKEPWIGPTGKPKSRKHWDSRIFRTVFAQVLDLFTQNLHSELVKIWKRDLYLVIAATNPLLPNPDSTQLLSRKHHNKGYSWLAFNWHDGLEGFTRPVSCRELVRKAYPQGSAKAATTWCKTNNGRFFDGTPPCLLYEKEFADLSLTAIDFAMRKKWELC